MKKILYFLMLVPMLAGASGTLSDKTIARVHVNLGSGIYFRSNQTMENPDGCNSDSWYHVSKGSTYEKEALAILLSAKLTGKKVEFYLDGCSGNYPIVLWINIYD